ncbi:uncharacterized [Tachysurus ichikawai]
MMVSSKTINWVASENHERSLGTQGLFHKVIFQCWQKALTLVSIPSHRKQSFNFGRDVPPTGELPGGQGLHGPEKGVPGGVGLRGTPVKHGQHTFQGM